MNKIAAKTLIDSAKAVGKASRSLSSTPVAASRSLLPTPIAATGKLQPVNYSRPKLPLSSLKNILSKAMINSAAKYHNLHPYMAMGPEALSMAATAGAGSRLFNLITKNLIK